MNCGKHLPILVSVAVSYLQKFSATRFIRDEWVPISNTDRQFPQWGIKIAPLTVGRVQTVRPMSGTLVF